MKDSLCSSFRNRCNPLNNWESYDMRDYVTAADGNWADDGSFGSRAKFLFVAYEEHFDWLMANHQEFPGIKTVEPIEGECWNEHSCSIHSEAEHGKLSSMVRHILKFMQISVFASSVVVESVDQSDIEALMSNAISPLNDSNLDNYEKTDHRETFLAKNFNLVIEHCEGVGILSVRWRLFIKDYKKKDKNKPNRKYKLKVKAWSALCNDLEELYADHKAAKDEFPDAARALGL